MFIHLRTHSAYSLLEGALHLKDLVRLARAHGQPAVGLTDTANLFGALEFAEAAANAGIQPIVGVCAPIVLPERIQHGRAVTLVGQLPLIAASDEGFSNLQRLISRAYLTAGDGPLGLPIEALEGASEGVIALSGWTDGPIGLLSAAGDDDAAAEAFGSLARTFGDRFYVELQRHDLPGESRLEAFLTTLAFDNARPLVATNNVFFETPDAYEAHDALLAIADGRRIADDERRRVSPQHAFLSSDAMAKTFADCPEALENTLEIAQRCHARPLKQAPMLPRFVSTAAPGADAEADEAAALRDMAHAGLANRLRTRGRADGLDEAAYRERLERELSIIIAMKFPGYFLIVADFIQWAKRQNIAVGPGRGSGAGSLVAYALTITDLDPLRFDLLFERFLNPERVSMPDFDIDFCQERRDEVIGYVQERYGADKVAQIITFGTLQARAVVRDVGRVLDMPYGKCDQLAKLVPSNPANPVSLGEAVKTEPRLQQMRDADPQVDRLLSMALRLEGLYRHASTHAAGIVIGDRPLDEIVPLYRDPRSDLPVTQYNMKWVESAGLVKFDFLGLKTLTTIERACGLIQQPIDLDTLPLNDKKAYDLLASGDTAGVFQLESQGMRKALIGMRPDCFEDIIAIVALYRPGPMDNIPSYNRRKHGLEKPDYLHQALEPVLRETHGIIIYQEQVMQIAQILSGYSLGEADLLRRAMGKKIAAEMAVQRDRFVNGAVERGTTAPDAQRIFDLVAKFANYGFNKSHAAAYALLAYHTAYLKANFPEEFLAASMTMDLGNTDKLADFRAEAQRLNIAVKPPSIARSKEEFSVADGSVLYGLSAVKGVGRPLVRHIVALRDERAFSSLADFARRLDPKHAPKRALSALIGAGALDDFGIDRGRVHAGIDQILGIAGRVRSGLEQGQNDFFGAAKDDEIRLPEDAVWTPEERLQKEHDAIGFYLSAHPLDDAADALKTAGVLDWRAFSAAGGGHRLAGVVVAKQERRTRSGGRMAVVAFSDPSGQFEGIVFQDQLEQFRDRLAVGAAVVLSVTAQEREEGLSIRIQNVEPLSSLAAKGRSRVAVFVDAKDAIGPISRLVAAPGPCTVDIIALIDREREVCVSLKTARNVTPSVINAMRSVKGVCDVRFV
ncbi:MAG: DNA polymerase III subunit alpha [Pseudomonadota bacterium]